MNRLVLILAFSILTVASFAQDQFFLGVWKFEKFTEQNEETENLNAMAEMFVKDMTLAFDESKYEITIMGKAENGTWSHLSENNYELTSLKRSTYTVEINRFSENQIHFKLKDMKLQFIKTANEAIIELDINPIDTINGVEIDKSILAGVWQSSGRIIDGKHSELVFKHKEGEPISYTFLENGEFINKTLLGMVINATWKIDEDKQTIIITGEDVTQYFKAVKLTDSEMHLYEPRSKSILKFTK